MMNSGLPRRARGLLTAWLWCVTALILTACGGAQNVINSAPPKEEYRVPQYRIGAGDTLQIDVWKNAELSGNALVRPDGMISIPLIGDIRAIEQTTDELATKITEKLTTFIRTPQVAVIVTNPASADFQRRVRVTGAVNNPTTVPYREGMTIMDLVLSAGGLNEFAAGNKAVLHRKNNEGETAAYAIRLQDIFSKGDLTTNYSLRPSDVITVPERRF